MENKVLQGDMEYIAKNFQRSVVFENKTILLTGAAGFLGFNFVQFFFYLLKNGINLNLILLDNFLLGKPSWIGKIEKPAAAKNIKIYNFNIARDKVNTVIGSKTADFIIHMASIASPSYYRKYPLQTIDANVWGLRQLLEFYKKRKIQGFLFFSSSEIYGDPEVKSIPINEEYRGNVSCLGPRACYDEAKRFSETLCFVFAKTYHMPLVIVRPFNNYGPGMRLNDKRVPADFAQCVVNNKDIIIHSDGRPKRTFCYAADAMVGYLKALLYGELDYFNIGIDKPEISIEDLARLYSKAGKRLFKYSGRVVFRRSKDKEYLKDNPQRRCPDIGKARKILGFKPKIKVNYGVLRYLEYLKEERIKR